MSKTVTLKAQIVKRDGQWVVEEHVATISVVTHKINPPEGDEFSLLCAGTEVMFPIALIAMPDSGTSMWDDDRTAWGNTAPLHEYRLVRMEQEAAHE